MTDREYAKMCVGNGWHSLVDEAYDLCEKYGVEITQIKEKFGQIVFTLDCIKRSVRHD